MKRIQTDSTRASSLQVAISVALLSASAILFASSFRAAPPAAQDGFYPPLPAPPAEAALPFLLSENIYAPASTLTLGNYPDTSIPLSADTTVTPDAAPTNTTSINVSASTNFHGTLAGDPTTGAVRVTDAHPAGTYTVTVRAFNGGGPTTTRTFTLTVTTPVTCTPVSFPTTTNFGTGPFPVSVAVGDFNGDGRQDIAVANFGLAPPHSAPGSVWILLGNGAGNFSATNFATGPFSHPFSIAVGDFNGDGKQDLALADYGPGGVLILLGDGAGNFGAPTSFAGGAYAVVVGDFNGDGKQDLAETGDGVSILLGDGAGSFSAATNFGTGPNPYSVAVGDFNGDGKQDLAVANEGSDNVSILLGDGAGSFTTATNFGAGSQPRSVAVGDFNGDGKQDLAVANSGWGNVSILLGDGAGHFSAATNFGAGNVPFSVAVGDFNGDGKQDLAVPNRDSDNVSILLGDGAGNFSAPMNLTAGPAPFSVAVGDFNGDGKQDLAATNGNNVSILLRDCPTAPTPSPTATPPPGCTLTEGFENIATLVPNGWVRKNNSQPLGTTAWLQADASPYGDFWAQAGSPSSYIVADFLNGSELAIISNWLLTPPVTLQNGAKFSFWTSTEASPDFPDRLQLRMSTNGTSQDVGSTATSVGDFSTLLLDINPTYTTTGYPIGWTNFVVTLSGIASPVTGRLGFRYFVENGGPSGANSYYIGIDTVAYYCNGTIPTPTPATPTPTPSVTPTPGTLVSSVAGTLLYCSTAQANVRINVTGSSSESTSSDGSGNYDFRFLRWGGTYIVTPSKADLAPGTNGISTTDVIAIQRHFLSIFLIPPGCRLAAADVNGDTTINTVDVIAVQRFFLALATGIANVGHYQFTPANRTYSGNGTNWTAQNYDAVVVGDVAAPFVQP